MVKIDASAIWVFVKLYVGSFCIVTALTSCANLKDEHYARCHRVCAEPVLATEHPMDTEISSPVIVEKEVPVIQPMIINTDALFAFDQYALSAVQSKGLQQIDDLIEVIKKTPFEITRVRIVGHADLIGTSDYNQRLSELRAQTIHHYLVNRGISARIEAIGIGSLQPISTDCVDIKLRAVRIHCEAPNRRVTIEVLGVSTLKEH